jgi:exopolyphosphatase/guanosine-5'-triphosphate,3'-diphosphate pyrophosphatase
VMCLRLAAIKCHARRNVSDKALTLKVRGREAQISFKSGWAEQNLRTLYLLQEEAAVWTRSGPLRLVLAG